MPEQICILTGITCPELSCHSKPILMAGRINNIITVIFSPLTAFQSDAVLKTCRIILLTSNPRTVRRVFTSLVQMPVDARTQTPGTLCVPNNPKQRACNIKIGHKCCQTRRSSSRSVCPLRRGYRTCVTDEQNPSPAHVFMRSRLSDAVCKMTMRGQDVWNIHS